MILSNAGMQRRLYMPRAPALNLLVTGHDGHTEALQQKRSRFNRAEVGAGNKQQIIGEIGQLFLGKGLSALPTV
jgi:hypothetical protein